MSTLRLRRKPLSEVVRTLDAFPKVPKSVEDKKAFGGAISIVCFGLIVWLVVGELLYYSEKTFAYKFSVDTEFDTKLQINVDLTVATPCDAIGADVMDATNQPLPFTYSQLKMDPARFKLSPPQRQYFEVMQNLHNQRRSSVMSQFQSLDHLVYMSEALLDKVRETDEQLTSRNADACRIHGFVRVNKVAGNFHVSPGKSLPIIGGGHAHISFFGSNMATNFSHRIDRLSFGPIVSSLVNPLDGTEKISKNAMDLFQYYVQVVPTKIHTVHGENVDTCQYSMTQRSRAIDHETGSHGTPGIFVKYDLSSVMVDVREVHKSYLELMIRLCAIVGGVFATLGFVNNLVGFAIGLCFGTETGGGRQVPVFAKICGSLSDEKNSTSSNGFSVLSSSTSSNKTYVT